MASYYVWSGATGAADGTSWANAYTTVTAAIASKAAGDTFYLAHDHAENNTATVTVSSPATAQFLCVNRAGSVPPVAADLTTGAQIKTTGTFTINWNADRYYAYGITFIAGDTSSSALNIETHGSGILEACHFKLASTSVSARIRPNGNIKWRNCTVEFASISQMIQPTAGWWVWENTANAITGATIPTALITANASQSMLIDGVDLSAVPSGKNIFAFGTSTNGGVHTLKNCKLASGVTIQQTAYNSWIATPIHVIHSDSVGNVRHERHHGVGAQTIETTIVRTGGASDGVTPISWKLVTAATCTFRLPMESLPIVVWNELTGATKTVTVEGVWGGGAVPDNDDIWIEVEYLGDASSPKGSFVSSAKANVLSTATSYATSSETWGGSTTKFKMAVTTGTINQKGPISVRIFAGLASSTFYVDPKITVA